MKSLLFAVGRWFDRRLGLRDAVVPLMEHPVPPQLEGPVGWWYIFGSASLTLLIVQILTGIGLSLVFVPTAYTVIDDIQHWFGPKLGRWLTPKEAAVEPRAAE